MYVKLHLRKYKYTFTYTFMYLIGKVFNKFFYSLRCLENTSQKTGIVLKNVVSHNYNKKAFIKENKSCILL